MNSSKTLFESIDSIFQKIAILELSDDQKQKTALACTTQMRGNLAYWCQVIISCIIAAFGLLQNSVAVIMGAMLIAPLFKPIQAMAFGIAKGEKSAFWNAVLLLAKSVIAAVATAAILVFLIPFDVETTEILARTTPNLLDLLIAIASAVIAFLAIYFEELSEGIGGVAMATSLMPPLAVVGIELAFGNFARSWGSLFLFLTNLFAIVFVGVVLFFMYGFSPHQKSNQKSTIQKLGMLLFLGLLIIIPLASSLLNLSDAVNLRLEAEKHSTVVLQELLPSSTLSEIELLEHSKEMAVLKGIITLPEGIELLAETQEAIQQNLSEVLERDVTLHLQVLRIASIVTKRDADIPLDQKIRDAFRKIVQSNMPASTIVKIDVARLEEARMPAAEGIERSLENLSMKWGIKTVLALPPDTDIDEARQNAIHTAISDTFPDLSLELFWVILPDQTRDTATVVTPKQQHANEMILKWDSFFKEVLPQDAMVENLVVTWDKKDPTISDFQRENIAQYSVKFTVYLAESASITPSALKQFIESFSQSFDIPSRLAYRIFEFESVMHTP